jgi:3-deoxy-manno-octulosonate cytidylyltransferase (CMP-KDO synthetase)
MTLTFKVVIPARYASTRFPGKPLALLAGRPMIAHVIDRARASAASEVIVATDDARIAAAARALGADVAMTRAEHVSGTERIAEVASQRDWPADAVVVNLQGDSPLMPAGNLRQVAELLHGHPEAALATLCVPISSPADYQNPNIVKVVMDAAGRALYFSRAPIPAAGHGAPAPTAWRHLGLYAYRVAALEALAAARPCELEQSEKLEQLRALWLGYEIRIAPALAASGPDVDTPEDLPPVAALLAAESAQR